MRTRRLRLRLRQHPGAARGRVRTVRRRLHVPRVVRRRRTGDGCLPGDHARRARPEDAGRPQPRSVAAGRAAIGTGGGNRPGDQLGHRHARRAQRARPVRGDGRRRALPRPGRGRARQRRDDDDHHPGRAGTQAAAHGGPHDARPARCGHGRVPRLPAVHTGVRAPGCGGRRPASAHARCVPDDHPGAGAGRGAVAGSGRVPAQAAAPGAHAQTVSSAQTARSSGATETPTVVRVDHRRTHGCTSAGGIGRAMW